MPASRIPGHATANATIAVELLRRFGLGAEARIDECCAMAARSCVITLTLRDTAAVADPALAA